ncbi:hypothetical protein Gotur_034821 [Gossypium turneri]
MEVYVSTIMINISQMTYLVNFINSGAQLGYHEDIKVSTTEELEKATNNYHESKILGQGTVY